MLIYSSFGFVIDLMFINVVLDCSVGICEQATFSVHSVQVTE